MKTDIDIDIDIDVAFAFAFIGNFNEWNPSSAICTNRHEQ